MAFKMKGFPMIGGTKPMKMAAKSAMKMKAEKAMKLKEEAAMKKKAMPDFPDVDGDGNTTEPIKSATASVKKTPKQLKEAAMKLKKGEAMKMKTPMKEEDVDAEVAELKNKKLKKIRAAGFKGTLTEFENLTPDQQINIQKLGDEGLGGANSTYINKKRNEILNPATERTAGASAKPMKKDAAMKLKEKPMKMKEKPMKMKEKAAMKMGHSPKKMGHKSPKKMGHKK